METKIHHRLFSGTVFAGLCLALSAVLLIPAIAVASPVVRSGDTVAVDQNQTVEGDFYGFGGVTTISGAINGDAYLFSGSVTTNATVSEDVTAIGGTIQIHEAIADDLRVVGGDVTVASRIGGDVAVFGGVLRILSTAEVEGDILFFGGELIIEGPVQGSIFGSGKEIRVNATVGGDIDVRSGGSLTLGDRASVQEMVEKDEGSLGMFIIPILMGLFVSFTAYLLFRARLLSVVRSMQISYGMQGLVGLAIFAGMPFVALILMVSVLGLFVGVFLLATYVALLVSAWVMAGIAVGTYVMQFFTKRQEVTMVTVAVGTILLELVTFVPLIGPLFAFVAVLISLGALGLKIHRRFL